MPEMQGARSKYATSVWGVRLSIDGVQPARSDSRRHAAGGGVRGDHGRKTAERQLPGISSNG